MEIWVKSMKNKFELIYRIAFIIICGIGISIHFDINDRDYNVHEFSFFTLWSNIFCLSFMCVLLVKHFRGKNTLAKTLIYFKGMATSCIICTFLVYHFSEYKIIMTNNSVSMFGLPIESILAHYVVPFMFVLDWIMFQPKGLFKWSYAITWLVFPFIYIVSFFIRCRCNSEKEFLNVPKYPYFFLNYEKIGVSGCMFYIFMLVIVFFGINLLVIFIDNFLDRAQKSKKNMV